MYENSPLTSRVEQLLVTAGIDLREIVSTRSIRLINKAFRAADESHLYPFVPATAKAIRWYSRVYFAANGPCSNLEYIWGLEGKISELVNRC